LAARVDLNSGHALPDDDRRAADAWETVVAGPATTIAEHHTHFLDIVK
jgi:hypothetical protein